MKKEKKRNKALSVILTLFCCLLGVILVFGVLNVMYYPKYKKNTEVCLDISTADHGSEIYVMSANVRTWSPTDVAKKSWFYRANLLAENIKQVEPDIIGFQEVTPMHYKYLTTVLQGYDNILTYRDESVLPEACPVFFNATRFELKDKGSFWLSETPEVMSKDWGAACYRICSYAILTDKSSNKDLVVFNTHLDHISDEARINGINVVLDKIKEFGGLPSIIMGDFNADEASSTYAAATESFLDAKYQTESTMTGATYQAFGKSLDRENIDYFMISKEGIEVKDYRIINTTYEGVYPSDHFPITITIELK